MGPRAGQAAFTIGLMGGLLVSMAVRYGPGFAF